MRVWLCPVLSIALAVAAFIMFGWSLWTALFLVALLTCPAMMVWSLVSGMRPLPFPIGPVPETRGHTLGWLAPYYDSTCRLFGLGDGFRQRTIAAAGLRPGEQALDVGCGTGVLTRLAANYVGRGGAVWGIDPAADMIRVARQNATSAGSTARFRPAAIENLPFDDGSIDVVLASLMLHHLPAAVKADGLKQVLRVLKPGGRLVVVELDRPRPAWWLVLWPLRFDADVAVHLHGRTPDLLRAAGFESVRRVATWRGLLSTWTARKPEAPVS